jgi:voltage-gated potassium channel Kch
MPFARGEGRAVLVVGEAGGLAAALMLKLEHLGLATEAAMALSDSDIAALLAERRWSAVAVITRDDVLALRLTLLSAHLRPDLPLWVTMFDRTITREIGHIVPAVHVLSPSELLVRAGSGLLLTLLFEAAISMIALHESPVDALYFSTRSVATVAGAPGAGSGASWFKILSAIDTLAALLLVAVFTAALVRRLSRPRLTTLLGARAAPARGHVLLVGFGQVGFRLAQELGRLGIPVLGVEQDPEAPCVRLARAAGIPVAIGRGDDRETLERLGIRHCAAVAAVTSTDLVNVAVGLAASDLAPGTPLVLRLGDGEVAAETDSLLHMGRICDAHKIAAETLVQGLRNSSDAR